MMQIVGLIAVWVGVVFCGIGVFGMMRFDNVYNRLHAAGEISTLGVGALLFGAALLMPHMALKLLALGVFMVIASPAATQALAVAVRHTEGR